LAFAGTEIIEFSPRDERQRTARDLDENMEVADT
jgi:hypothetical protein